MHMLYDVRVLNIVVAYFLIPIAAYVTLTGARVETSLENIISDLTSLQMGHIVCVTMNICHIDVYDYAVVHLREIAVHARSYNLLALHSSCDIRVGELCENKLSNPSGLV
jgi:hypothetical protein